MADEPTVHSAPTVHPGRVLARLARHLEVALAGLELTVAQYRMLGMLGDGREAASVLADKLAVSRPSVTGVVDGLVARGLVRRDQAGGDRRRFDLELTDAGRLLLDTADREVERRLTAIAERLDDGAAAERAFAALIPWDQAMRAWRQAKHAQGAARVAAVEAGAPVVEAGAEQTGAPA